MEELKKLARDSSLFSTASLHEHLQKKRDSSSSVLAMAQGPNEQPIKKKPKRIYGNTYRLEPPTKFQSDKVKQMIESALESHLKDETYEHKSCKQLVLTLSEIIKNKVKELHYQNYKIVCVVTIGQLKEQGFRMASRCCWDPTWDNFATGSYKNKTLFAIGSVWGVYYE